MENLAKLKAGMNFALAGLQLISESSRKEGHLLDGPYAGWLELAAGKCREAERSDGEDPLAALRTAFLECDRLLRAVDRLPPDIPDLVERFEETAQTLDGLRAQLGDPGIDGIVAAAKKAEDEAEKCLGCKGCGGGSDDEVPPLIVLVDALFREALKRAAEELHLLSGEKLMLLQYRLPDRDLPVCEVSAHLGRMIAARIKIMAMMDVSERRLPQNGVIEDLQGVVKDLSVRPGKVKVSAIPRPGGETVTVRFAPGKIEGPESGRF